MQVTTKNSFYKKIQITENFMINNDPKNKWFMTNDGKIIAMKNVSYTCNDYVINGSRIQNKRNFFISPFQSAKLNIYVSDGRFFNTLEEFKLCEIKCKMFAIDYNNEKVFFPLLHTMQDNKNN